MSDTREPSYSSIDRVIWTVVVIAIIGIGGAYRLKSITAVYNRIPESELRNAVRTAAGTNTLQGSSSRPISPMIAKTDDA